MAFLGRNMWICKLCGTFSNQSENPAPKALIFLLEWQSWFWALICKTAPWFSPSSVGWAEQAASCEGLARPSPESCSCLLTEQGVWSRFSWTQAPAPCQGILWRIHTMPQRELTAFKSTPECWPEPGALPCTDDWLLEKLKGSSMNKCIESFKNNSDTTLRKNQNDRSPVKYLWPPAAPHFFGFFPFWLICFFGLGFVKQGSFFQQNYITITQGVNLLFEPWGLRSETLKLCISHIVKSSWSVPNAQARKKLQQGRNPVVFVFLLKCVIGGVLITIRTLLKMDSVF